MILSSSRALQEGWLKDPTLAPRRASQATVDGFYLNRPIELCWHHSRRPQRLAGPGTVRRDANQGVRAKQCRRKNQTNP